MKLPTEWNEKTYEEFINDLTKLQDIKYQKFNEGLIPGVELTIGIQIPKLRKIAKEITRLDMFPFLECNHSSYLEATLLEEFIISHIKDINLSLYYLERIIPKIHNWQTCDIFCNSYKIVKDNKDLFFPIFMNYLSSSENYRLRVGIVMMLCYYREKGDIKKVLPKIIQINQDDYYVQMAISWLLCEYYLIEPNQIISLLENKILLPFIHNKTIQKINDSKRVTIEEKNKLKKLKI